MLPALSSVVFGGTTLSAGTYLVAFGDVAGGTVLWVLGVVWACVGLLMVVENASFAVGDGFDG
jgi:Flp pilus assembly protein TadB